MGLAIFCNTIRAHFSVLVYYSFQKLICYKFLARPFLFQRFNIGTIFLLYDSQVVIVTVIIPIFKSVMITNVFLFIKKIFQRSLHEEDSSLLI